MSFTENKPKAEKATILTGDKQKAESVSVLTEGKPKAENEMNSSENKNEESKEDRIKNEREDMPNATSVEPKELQATQQTATVSGKKTFLLLWEWENCFQHGKTNGSVLQRRTHCSARLMRMTECMV